MKSPEPPRPSSPSSPSSPPSGEPREHRAARLLGAARAFNPPVNTTFAEIQAAVRARRYGATHLPGRLLVAGAAGLALVLAFGSVALSRGWWMRRAPAAVPATLVTVPAGATTQVARKGRYRLSLRGPGTVEVPGADDGALRLPQGQLVLSSEGYTVVLEARGRQVRIPPAATVSLDASDGAGLRVTSLIGAEPTVDGAVIVDRPAHTPIRPDVTAAPAAPSVPSAPAAPAVIERTAAGSREIAPIVQRKTAGDSVPTPTPTPPPPPTPTPESKVVGAPAPEPSSAATEIAQVRDALQALRADKDPDQALRLLDDYDRRFPDGLLREEVVVTRIEALLAAGRSVEALDRLDAFPRALLDHSPRLRVARGELRAAHRRCAEALADFAAALSASPGGEVERRAARGRAACDAPTAKAKL
jgi:hypothetical protein